VFALSLFISPECTQKCSLGTMTSLSFPARIGCQQIQVRAIREEK
jgi:hypothetical protein